MTRYIAIAAVLAIAGFFWWQQHTITGQRAALQLKDARIAEVTAANVGLEVAMEAMHEARERDALITEATLTSVDTLNTNARTLRAQLQEALRHAQTVDMDAPLPAAAADALCLRYLAARGQSPDAVAGDAAIGAHAGAAHSLAAACGPWRVVTLRDVVEWAGLLLDHAGAERLDKAGLRRWAHER